MFNNLPESLVASAAQVLETKETIQEAVAPDRKAAVGFLQTLEEKVENFADIDLIEAIGIMAAVLAYNLKDRGDQTLLSQVRRLNSEISHLDAQITNRFFAKK